MDQPSDRIASEMFSVEEGLEGKLVSEIRHQYASAQAAYALGNLEGAFAYAAPEWVFISTDGVRETLEEAWWYARRNLELRQQGEEHTTYIDRTVRRVIRVSEREIQLDVSVVITKSSKKVLSHQQRDTWIKVLEGSWRCVEERMG